MKHTYLYTCYTYMKINRNNGDRLMVNGKLRVYYNGKFITTTKYSKLTNNKKSNVAFTEDMKFITVTQDGSSPIPVEGIRGDGLTLSNWTTTARSMTADEVYTRYGVRFTNGADASVTPQGRVYSSTSSTPTIERGEVDARDRQVLEGGERVFNMRDLDIQLQRARQAYIERERQFIQRAEDHRRVYQQQISSIQTPPNTPQWRSLGNV